MRSWIIAIACLLVAAAAQAQVPLGTNLTYQAQLKSEGQAFDGSADLQVALFDAPAGGQQIGAALDQPSVAVSVGNFTVPLDFGAAAFTGDARWLEISVRAPAGSGTYTMLLPRQPLTAAPYALHTRGLNVDSAGNLGIGTTGPGCRLHVNYDPANAVGVFAGDRAPGGYAAFQTNMSAPSTHAWFAENENRVFSVEAGGRVTASGSLGIRTSDSSRALSVSGEGMFFDGQAAVEVRPAYGGAHLLSYNAPLSINAFYTSPGVTVGYTHWFPWERPRDGKLTVHNQEQDAFGGGPYAITAVGAGSGVIGYGSFRAIADNAVGVAGDAAGHNGIGVLGHYYDSFGYTGYAGWFEGRLNVSGTLSKSGGSFKIDHPLDPENKTLSHSFVESPDMMNVHNGNVSTDAAGNAWVELPSYFDALNRDFRYPLTAIGQFAQVMVAEKISNNRFRIKTDKPSVEVSWPVSGIRQDAWAHANPIQVEEDKAADKRGKYLTPAAYGLSDERGMMYDALPQRPDVCSQPASD